jgi:hypothetical protein
MVIKKIEAQPPSPMKAPTQQLLYRTPIRAAEIRQFRQLFEKEPTPRKVNKLFNALERCQARANIAEYRADGLVEAFAIEKTKRKRGKRLNLKGEPAGNAEFWGSEEIDDARVTQAEKEAEEEKERAEIINRRVQAEIAKANKAAAKAEKALQRELERNHSKELKEQEASLKRATQEAKKKNKPAPKKKGIERILPQQPKGKDLATDQEISVPQDVLINSFEEEEVVVTSRGRMIKPPQRYRS